MVHRCSCHPREFHAKDRGAVVPPSKHESTMNNMRASRLALAGLILCGACAVPDSGAERLASANELPSDFCLARNELALGTFQIDLPVEQVIALAGKPATIENVSGNDEVTTYRYPHLELTAM